MKYTKYILGLAAVAMLAACHKYNDPKDITYDGKHYAEEGSAQEWKATMTIGELVSNEKYFSEFGDTEKYPPRSRSYNKSGQNLGLFSVQDITDNIIIVGRIASTDVPGNIYKSIYIQDCENPDYGMKISVDAGSLGGQYPIGQKIAIKLQGLAIGKYARMPQIGVPYYNNGKEGLDNNATGKSGWEIGRIPPQVFKEHVQLIGIPNKSKIMAKDMTIAEIKATANDYKEIAKLSSRLVRINGVSFVPYTWNNDALKELSGTIDCDNDGDANVFAPTTDGRGYPQSRLFTCGRVDSVLAVECLALGTSEYAKFACATLPRKTYKGSVTGFISYYWDNGSYQAYNNKVWSIVINGLESLSLKSGDEEWRADDVYYPAY